MATTPDDILINAVMQAESRGKRFDKAGNLLTSVKGAEGEMQVMPTTQTKPGFGVKPAQDSSAEEKARVGRDYLKAMISKYGDTTAALAAYNWGPGRVNKWLDNGGDFNALPKETQKYIKTIQASLPKGTQLASAPPAKANKAPVKTTSAKPSAPPPVPITKEMVADLGPNYQAALAAMALGDTREDDDDEESIAEQYAAKQEKLAEEAASAPPPRIAGMEMTYQSPFPEEQIAQAPEGLAHGGMPRRGNSARDALRMMREAQQQEQQQPVRRAEGGVVQEFGKGGVIKKAAELLKGMGVSEGKVAGKDLTTLQDAHTSLGDSIRDRTAKMQQQMDAMDFKYNRGQYVFTEGSAKNNRPPLVIKAKQLYGNVPMREPHPENPLMGKVIKDPATGLTKRTPYEPGYLVRREGPEGEWSEFVIPQSAIKGAVDNFAYGGIVRRAEGSPEEGEKAATTARELYAQIKRSGEAIDEGGLKYWTERAQSNQQSPEALQKEFMAAADAADDPYYEVNRMYQRTAQTPDTEGFNYWVNRAQQEKLTPQQLGSQFIGGMPAITAAQERAGFGAGGQYGTYNGLPMLYAPEVDRVMDREQRITGDLVNRDNSIGWDPSSISGELSRGAAAAGVYRTPFSMGGQQQAFQGDLVGTAKQYGLDPEQYMTSSVGQYGQPGQKQLNENALYGALDEKMKDYYAVQGYVPPAGTENSAFNRTDIGGDHARVMYQRVGDRLVPMENTLQYSNQQRAPKYSWTDYIAPAAIVAAPWALPYLSTVASAINWGPIGAEVGKGALIGAGKSIIQGQNPITGAIQGGASGLIPSPFADGGPVYRAGGSPEVGEYYQDPMGMDTGPITEDTTKALQLRQGLSAKDALGTLKGIAKEGVSNAESALRGSGAAMPGMVGDVEAIFRDEKKRKFKTTDEILKTEMPKRMTTPTKEAAGFEEVGTYLPVPVSPQVVKGGAKAALAGLKASGPQVEKALMKAAPGAEPMYAVKPGGGTFFPKGSGSRVDDYLESIVQALPLSGIDVPGKDLTTIADFIRNKGHKYLTSEYGTLNDPVRAAVSEGRMPMYGKDEEVFRDYLLQAARDGSPNAMKDLEKFYDTRTALRGDVIIPSEEFAKSYQVQFDEAEKAREKLNKVFNQQGVLPDFRNPNLLGKDEKLLSESYSIPPNKLLAALLKGERAPASAAEEAMLFAAKNKEPIYDFNYASPEMQMFNPKDVARGIAALLQKGTKISDLDKMTFPEALVRGAQETKVYRSLDDAVEKLDKGKPIPLMWFTQGVTTVIPKLPKSSNTWVKIDTPEALRIEAAAMNHSIDGYAKKGKYGAGGLEAFLKGDVEVYSLRNAEKKPLTTVEVRVEKGKNLLSQIRNRFNSVPNEEQQLEVFQLLDKLKPAEIWPVTYKRDAFGRDIEHFDVSWRSLYRDYLDKNKSLD